LSGDGFLQSETDNAWRVLHTEHSAVFPVGFDPDWSVVRAIRLFDPEYVPLWARKVYRTPTGGLVVFGYHVIGRHIQYPTEDPWATARKPVRLVNKPADYPWSEGAVYEQKWWATPPKQGTQAYREAWPPLYRPHNWRLLPWMEQAHWFLLRGRESAKAKMLRQIQQEREAEKKELDTVRDDAKRHLKDQLRGKTLEPESFIPPPPPDPKPYVQAGHVWE